MGDVTISETQYKRLEATAAKARAESKLEHEVGHAALTTWGGDHEVKGKGRTEKAMAFGKAAVQTVLVGAGVYFIATLDLFDKIALFKEHWWLKPLVLMGLGFVLAKKMSPFATPVLASAAGMFIQAWRARPGSTAKKDGTTQGPDDEEAGRWDWVDDTYGRRGRWHHTPHGGHAYMTGGHGAHAAERMAERVFEHARPI